MAKKKKKTKVGLSRKEFISYLRQVAKCYGMKAHFIKMGPLEGGYANLDGSFVVNNDQDLLNMAGCFFHELAHELNREEGKFKHYHNPKLWKRGSKADRKLIARTAWRAEVYTDKRGKKLMEEWMPGYKYNTIYHPSNKGLKKWLVGYIKNDPVIWEDLV